MFKHRKIRIRRRERGEGNSEERERKWGGARVGKPDPLRWGAAGSEARGPCGGARAAPPWGHGAPPRTHAHATPRGLSTPPLPSRCCHSMHRPSYPSGALHCPSSQEPCSPTHTQAPRSPQAPRARATPPFGEQAGREPTSALARCDRAHTRLQPSPPDAQRR